MSQRRFDIVFSSDTFLSCVLGLILFIAATVVLTSNEMRSLLRSWSNAAHATYTIEIDPSESKRLDVILKKTASYFGVEKIIVLDPSYVRKLLDQNGESIVNPPVLVDVVVDPEDSRFSSLELREELIKIAPSTRLLKPDVVSPEAISHAKFLDGISLWFSMTMLILFCCLVVFMIYSEIQIHQRTIYLFSLLGAPASYIARTFKKYTSLLFVKAFGFFVVFSILAIFSLWCLHSIDFSASFVSLQSALLVCLTLFVLFVFLTVFLVPFVLHMFLSSQYRKTFVS